MGLAVGTQLGPYEILAQVSAGIIGGVYGTPSLILSS